MGLEPKDMLFPSKVVKRDYFSNYLENQLETGP